MKKRHWIRILAGVICLGMGGNIAKAAETADNSTEFTAASEENDAIEISTYLEQYEQLPGILGMIETDYWQFPDSESYVVDQFYLEWKDGLFSIKNEGAANVELFGVNLGDTAVEADVALQNNGWLNFYSDASQYDYAALLNDKEYVLALYLNESGRVTSWYLNNWPQGDEFESIFSKLRGDTETVTGDEKPEGGGTGDIRWDYGNILWQYLDVWEMPDVSLEMWEEFNIVNYLVYYGNSSGEETLAYSLVDIDGNGTEELLIGLNNGYGEDYALLDIYTYTEGKVVLLLEGAERTHLSLCKDGIISSNGSGGAAHNYQKYYTLGENGKSCEMFKYYYINSEDYYVEDVDGNTLAFDGNFDQYLYQYEMEEINWTIIDENSITENFVERDNAGTALTKLDITLAPVYKNGMIDNSYDLFWNYYMKIMGKEKADPYRMERDYEEQQIDTDIYYILEEDSGNRLSTISINLQTGDAVAMNVDGTRKDFNILQ